MMLPVGRIARRYAAADRKPLVDALDDLFPGFVIDDLGCEIEPPVVDGGLLRDTDSRGPMHLAYIRKPHIVAESRFERLPLDNLTLLVERLGRGISPYHSLLGIDLGDRPIKSHS